MKLTDNIIKDLISVYMAGEASQDTKELIHTCIKEKPELKALLSEQQEIIEDIIVQHKIEDEMILLKKTKNLLKLRSLLFAFAIFFTATPFAFGDVSWSNEKGVHWLWKDFPEGALITGLTGILAWAVYIMIGRRLKVTGL